MIKSIKHPSPPFVAASGGPVRDLPKGMSSCIIYAPFSEWLILVRPRSLNIGQERKSWKVGENLGSLGQKRDCMYGNEIGRSPRVEGMRSSMSRDGSGWHCDGIGPALCSAVSTDVLGLSHHIGAVGHIPGFRVDMPRRCKGDMRM